MKNFKNLQVWQKAGAITVKGYQLSEHLGSDASNTFRSQVTRSALSIPSNIAEGSSRRSKKDHFRFLEISLGSTFELETQLLIMKDIKVVGEEEIEPILNDISEVQKMLYGLMKVIKANS